MALGAPLATPVAAQNATGQSGAGQAVQVTAFMQAVAEAASDDSEIAAFYRATNYQPIWTSNSARDASRRRALLAAVQAAPDQGLPAFDTTLLSANMRAITSEREQGQVEVALSKLFLTYARDLQTGILTPSQVVSDIKRVVPLRDGTQTLINFTKSSPAAFLRGLAPSSPEYTRLMREKLTMEKVIGQGGWGPQVPNGKLEPGASGAGVVALRNRLMAMGDLGRTNTATYDAQIQKAVQIFQMRHGLAADGVVGAGTLAAINIEPAQRLASIVVAMERERWMNIPRTGRYIWVNITDFTAKIYDDDKLTFETRSVVGANDRDRRTPEFSDMMEHMVINPSWNVPRSITTKEYLPLMQKNPNAAGQLDIVDNNGRVVPRSAINFNAYTASNFPYRMRQPPSDGNALGLVKFMFPNKYNIYLHDTPSKSLFARESRAFSHGCVRLNDPFDFAYALLAKQSSDPVGEFQSHLRTGQESVIALQTEVPVHLVYRTAISMPKGGMEYRTDVYGRDAAIWAALQNAGVQLRAVGG
ncbi:L,D-transpeptidase family protein [Aquimixticola soesokkakensis]